MATFSIRRDIGSEVSTLTAPPLDWAAYVMRHARADSAKKGSFSRSACLQGIRAATFGRSVSGSAQGAVKRYKGQKSSKRRTKGSVTAIDLAIKARQKNKRVDRK